jgi:hypothetical protein
LSVGKTKSSVVFGRDVADLSMTIRRAPSSSSAEALYVSATVEKEKGRVCAEGLGGPSDSLLLTVAVLAGFAFTALSEI